MTELGPYLVREELGRGGAVEVGDFGLAKVPDQVGLTQVGCIVGTPAYLAPEVLMGKDATPAADVFGLGCVLFEAITGRRHKWKIGGRPQWVRPRGGRR